VEICGFDRATEAEARAGEAGVNVARGYRRCAIAVVGSWIAVWAAIGGFAAWQQGIWSNIFIEASRAGRDSELAFANQRAQENAEIVGMALMWSMLALPMALAFALGWWVYRGFKPA
jgi:hypothetical protein